MKSELFPLGLNDLLGRTLILPFNVRIGFLHPDIQLNCFVMRSGPMFELMRRRDFVQASGHI
jgi:hypothetical protein